MAASGRTGAPHGIPGVVTGVDLVEIDRFRTALRRRPRLAERVFCAGELARCRFRRDPAPCLAVRFAAKEAVGKLLGTGVLNWREIEIVGGEPPEVRLSGRTLAAAERLGLQGPPSLSLSHSRTMAVAVAAAVLSGGEEAAHA